MGQVPPPKFFNQPMPFGASQANNVVSQSQPVAQAPQPSQPFINLNDPSLQGVQQPQAQPNPYQQQYQYPQYGGSNQSFYGRNYYTL